MHALSEAQWVEYAQHLMTRPPMPWFSVQAINKADLQAIYHFVKSLGPASQPAPAFLPPDKAPKPPYIQWPMPQQ